MAANKQLPTSFPVTTLPKYVAFREDNGSARSSYVRAESIDEKMVLTFSGSDATDPAVWNEILEPVGDGSFRIKYSSLSSGNKIKTWRRDVSSNWVLVGDCGADSNVYFVAVKVNNDNTKGNVVALRSCSIGNERFVERFSSSSVKNGLVATADTIAAGARLVVEELVSRRIFDVKFHREQAKITYTDDVVVATVTAENPTKHATYTAVVVYPDSKTSTWSTKDPSFRSIEATISSATPFVVDDGEGHISYSGEFSGPYQWGETHTSTSSIETTQIPVTVPTMTRVKVSVLAKRGSAEIPFDYSQSDTLIVEKKTITDHKNDGVYTSVRFYKPYHKIEQDPFSP